MFNTDKIKSLQNDIARLEKRNEENLKEYNDIIARLQRANEIAAEDRALEQKRDELATANKITEATAELKKENTKLQIELGQIKKENEVMTKAFENMGFDVKDSKEMMSDLIKALGVKNQVQVIK